MTHDSDDSDKELDSLLNREGHNAKSRQKPEPASSGHPQRSLDELLDGANTSEKEKTAKPVPKRRKGTNDASAPIESVLSSYNSNSSARDADRHKAGSHKVKNTPIDLDQLLDNAQGTQTGDTSRRKAARRKATGASPADLDQLLDNAQGTLASDISPRNAGGNKARDASAADLDQQLEITPGSKRKQEDRTSFYNAFSARLGWVMIAGLVIAAVFFMLPIQDRHPADIEQHISQGTLNALVSDIEQYIEQNSELPADLEGFPSFPASAVSWPISSWNVRNIEGKTEIFWLPQADMSYSVIVRDASGAWLYDFYGQVVFISKDDSAYSGS